MTVQKVFAVLALIAIVVVGMGMFAEAAHAQNDSEASKSIDKDVAQRKGVAGSLASGDKDEDDEAAGPTKAQMAIGLGSVVVMIIVVKWL